MATKTTDTDTKKERRFAQDWGRDIEAVGFTMIPNALIQNFRKLGLTHVDMCIVMVLLRYWHRDRPTWLSKKKIAEMVGIKSRSVQRRITAMHNKILVRERRKHRDGDDDTNHYHMDKLAELLEPYAKKMLAERAKKKAADKPGLRPALRVVA
jgi:hypothetical protein